MNINRVVALYFSPNGTTKEIVEELANSIGSNIVEKIDLTHKEARTIKREFKEDDLVIIGLPVYANRLPSISENLFKNIKGHNTPTVTIVSYGNRDYGDALLELRNELIKKDMKVISGAAIIGQHCLNNNVATGRPDEEDKIKILEFAKNINEKLLHIEDIKTIEDIFVAGSYPYHPLKPHNVPIGDSKCIQCGICQEQCPENAIDEKDYRITNPSICISCGHCIIICPTDARDIKLESFTSFMKKLEIIAGERREISVFI